jgi:hypothetical protein
MKRGRLKEGNDDVAQLPDRRACRLAAFPPGGGPGRSASAKCSAPIRVARTNPIVALRNEQERRMTFVEDSRALVEKTAGASLADAMQPNRGTSV